MPWRLIETQKGGLHGGPQKGKKSPGPGPESGVAGKGSKGLTAYSK